MVTPVVHEVAYGLGTAPDVIAGAVTAYMVPFAALMLVSGTLAERWGRGATMRVSLAVSVVACGLCALAPNAESFLVARALQGATNAFTTPLLVAAITDVAPRERLGRAMGLFAGAQAAGQALSPLVSGLSSVLDWRLAFLFPALAAVLLVRALDAVPPRQAPGRPSWRSLANARLAGACALSFLCYLGAVGLTVLATLRAADAFGLGPAGRGAAGAAFGVAGLLLAPLCGRGLDRLGPHRLAALASGALTCGLLLAALGPSVPLLVAGVAVVGVAVTAIRSSVNALAATSVPGNRGGAASLALSTQFFGGALAPVLWVPLYEAAPRPGFAATALAPLAALALLACLSMAGARRTRRSRSPACGPDPLRRRPG